MIINIFVSITIIIVIVIDVMLSTLLIFYYDNYYLFHCHFDFESFFITLMFVIDGWS